MINKDLLKLIRFNKNFDEEIIKLIKKEMILADPESSNIKFIDIGIKKDFHQKKI